MGILGAGMAVSANDAFAAQQVIIPEGTVIELRASRSAFAAAFQFNRPSRS